MVLRNDYKIKYLLSLVPLCGFLSYKPILLIILYSGMPQNFVEFSLQCAALRLKSALFWNKILRETLCTLFFRHS